MQKFMTEARLRRIPHCFDKRMHFAGDILMQDYEDFLKSKQFKATPRIENQD